MISLNRPLVSPPTRNAMLRGLIMLRWITAAWLTVAYAWEVWRRNDLASVPDVAHPIAGAAVCAAIIAINAVITVVYQRAPARLLGAPLIAAEATVAAVALFSDEWVFDATHGQVLPSIWPVCVVATLALAAGRRPAVAAGIGLGILRYVGWLIARNNPETAPLSMARTAQIVLLGVTGWVAGFLFLRLAAADKAISGARAREEVARTLHDGVLQTLAVIQRRSDDTELVALARDQEVELRTYLFTPGDLAPESLDLATAVREAAHRAERRHQLKVTVVIDPDLPSVPSAVVEAVSGAIGEALNNASSHGDANQATIYAAPDDDHTIVVSVKDNGRGFDPDAITYGQGINRSIVGRMTEVKGWATIDGRPGRGSEVWLHY